MPMHNTAGQLAFSVESAPPEARHVVERDDGIAIECWTRGSGPLMVLLPSLGRGVTWTSSPHR
jgi:hypothetical protein